MIVHNSEEFDKALLANKVVLADFFATWCGPCRMLAPVIEEIEGGAGDKFAVLKVDVDENEKLAMRYGIMSIPTIIVFKNGVAADKKIGLASKADIVGMIEKQL